MPRSTEKIPGMFGTLVVCLPSAHKGGEVGLQHCGKRKVFASARFSQSFASWYSDVSHEVHPVKSGFRWVLTYNLAHDLTRPRPSAGLHQFETQALRRTLSRWLGEARGSRERNFVYHVLDQRLHRSEHFAKGVEDARFGSGPGSERHIQRLGGRRLPRLAGTEGDGNLRVRPIRQALWQV